MSSTGAHGSVTFRVDKRPAVNMRLIKSNDHTALSIQSGTIAFIKTLYGGSTLFVRATPFSHNEVSGEFNISGLQEAITPLRRACAWPA